MVDTRKVASDVERVHDAAETLLPVEPQQIRAMTRGRILLMTTAMFGIAFNWGAQYSRITPILQELGIEASCLGLAWFAGPISVIVIQPWVGYQSDRTTLQWGR